MTQDKIIGGGVPIIGAKKSSRQDLIIRFEKQANGDGGITFHFDPDIPAEPANAEQQAAINVAKAIIDHFNLDKTEEKQNAKSTTELQ
jgi:hypothetical protein